MSDLIEAFLVELTDAMRYMPADDAEIRRLYGDPDLWERLPIINPVTIQPHDH